MKRIIFSTNLIQRCPKCTVPYMTVWRVGSTWQICQCRRLLVCAAVKKNNHLVSDDICGKSVFDSASKVVLSSCGRRLCVPVPLCGSERWLCRLFFGWGAASTVVDMPFRQGGFGRGSDGWRKLTNQTQWSHLKIDSFVTLKDIYGVFNMAKSHF
jgi:hypothetical protein